MFRSGLAICIAALCTLTPSALLRCQAPAHAPSRISGEDLAADLGILEHAYESMHPGLLRYNSEAQIAAAFAEARSQLSPGSPYRRGPGGGDQSWGQIVSDRSRRRSIAGLNRTYDIWGASAAGTVLAVGEDLPAELVGRGVAIYRSLSKAAQTLGLWSEQVLVERTSCVVLPESASAGDYSGLLVNVITAYAFLRKSLSKATKA